MATTTIPTTKLNANAGHRTVLAKPNGHAWKAVNLTQANRKAESLRAAGVECDVIGRYPLYVAIGRAA